MLSRIFSTHVLDNLQGFGCIFTICQVHACISQNLQAREVVLFSADFCDVFVVIFCFKGCLELQGIFPFVFVFFEELQEPGGKMHAIPKYVTEGGKLLPHCCL